MRQTERMATTTLREVVVAVYCDICGTEGCESGWPVGGGGGFEVNETTVRFKTGKQYPEYGSGVVHEADICPRCFRERLIPWLNTQGVFVRETEWETG